MGTSSDKKVRRLPSQPAGWPMGTHAQRDTEKGDDPCRCGACSSGIKASTAAKIGNKAAAIDAQAAPKKGKK